MPRRTPCPGAHNDSWREAEAAGRPHELTPVYGDVRWCTGCHRRIHSRLVELPSLYAQLHLELTEATTPVNLLTAGRGASSSEPALHPGEKYLRAADDIYDRVVEWAALLRTDRQLSWPPSAKARPGFVLDRDVRLLAAHLAWLLDEHPSPDASREFDREIGEVWANATRMTGQAPVRPAPRDGVPCPSASCRMAALETEVVDGKHTGYVVCRACSRLLTEDELQAWIAEAETVIAAEAAAAAEPGGDML